MKEVTVLLWDDLAAQEGLRVVAETTDTITLNGSSTELDLSMEHSDILHRLLMPYFKAGHKPAGDIKGLSESDSRGRRDTEFYTQMRAFADRFCNGAGYSERKTAPGRYQYSTGLKKAYEEYLQTGKTPDKKD